MNVQSVNSYYNTANNTTKYNSEKSSAIVKEFSLPQSEMPKNILDKDFLFFSAPDLMMLKNIAKGRLTQKIPQLKIL